MLYFLRSLFVQKQLRSNAVGNWFEWYLFDFISYEIFAKSNYGYAICGLVYKAQNFRISEEKLLFIMSSKYHSE